MAQFFRILAFLIAASFTVIFALAYHARYFRWRDCFNELGRCYDSASATVYLEQAGLVWGLFALCGAIVTAVLARGLWRKRNSQTKNAPH